MSCIPRGPANFGPLIETYKCSSIVHYCLTPRHANKWFSQSSQRFARRKHYTPEQLAVFTNHYRILGLSKKATDADIKKSV